MLRLTSDLDNQIKGLNGSLVFDYNGVLSREFENYISRYLTITPSSTESIDISSLSKIDALIVSSSGPFDLSFNKDGSNNDVYLGFDIESLYHFFGDQNVPSQLKIKSKDGESDIEVLVLIAGT